MDVSVDITVGTVTTNVTLTDTGCDGLHEAVDQARATIHDLVTPEACAAAAASVWVEA